MRKGRGFTLPEVLVATAIFGMVTGLVVTFFVLSQRYYSLGSHQLDVQFSAQAAIGRLTREIQESDPSGISIGVSHDAIVFLSARDANNNFKAYNGLSGGSSNCGSSLSTDAGKPCWEKWVCYTLSGSDLVRVEGNPTGSPFPTTTVPSSIPSPASFPAGTRVAQNISTLDLENLTCGTSGNPLYLQITANENFAGEPTNYNPGAPVSFSGCAKSGNWIQINIKN